jgi:structural maintenance of chromosome 1
LKKPDLVATETQIKHSTRKSENAHKNREEMIRSAEAKQEKLNHLKKELNNVKKQADDAQGIASSLFHIQIADLYV